MRNLLLRLGLTLALAASLGAAAQQAKPAPQAAEPLISDCKTISCLRNLLRGAEGPPGPRGPAGPAGRSSVKDVYAGTYRIGRLVALSSIDLCPGSFNSGVDRYQLGLTGLVETSTGYLVHLCIGPRYEAPDVGTTFAGLAERQVNGRESLYAYHFYREPDCAGPLYGLLTSPENGLSNRFVGEIAEVSGAGSFGPLMGKPRIVPVQAGFELSPPARTGTGYRFMIAGEPELMSPKSFRDERGEGCSNAVGDEVRGFYIKLTPNDPSISGMPNAPITPYTLVDVQ